MRRISVIVPMFNEAENVERLLSDIAAQDFEGALEVIVADGGSTDGSVERLREAAERAGLDLIVIANPRRWVSHGLNACIQQAEGDLIVRLDCHSRYPPDYFRRCAHLAEETGAWNVGGIVVPEGRTLMERAAACAMASAFGGIGWSRHAKGTTWTEVDTVTYGAFRPQAFGRIGLFDESLIRNQDDELNLRLREAGGRIVLDPSMHINYTPRGSLRAVFRQYYEYGVWKVPVMLKHRKVLSMRSLAPLGFVGSILVLAPAVAWIGAAAWLLACELVAYAVATLAFGVASVKRRRESWRLLPLVLAVFPAFHIAYGLGMLNGFLRAVARAVGRAASAESG